MFLMFQHTAARRRLGQKTDAEDEPKGFNTQPPEGGWTISWINACPVLLFQHTAARRRLESGVWAKTLNKRFQHTAARRRLENGNKYRLIKMICFNTQPPEGGWNHVRPVDS